MKSINGEIAACIYWMRTILALGFTVYGLILSFAASFWLGILVLILEPMPLVIGLMKCIGIDLVEMIVGK